jgi:DNA repair exonuclease SbcCD ATPase subunit
VAEVLEKKLEELNRERYQTDQEIEEYENWLRKAEKAEMTHSEGERAARQAREVEEQIQTHQARIRADLEDLSLARAVESLLEVASLLDQVAKEPRPDLRNRIEKLRGLSLHSVRRAAIPLDQAKGILSDLQERARNVGENQLRDRHLRAHTREESVRLDEQVQSLRHSLETAERSYQREEAALTEKERRLANLDAELETLRVRAAPFRNLTEEETRLLNASSATESEYHEWLRLESEAMDEEARRNLVTSLEREGSLQREAREQLERHLIQAQQEAGSQEQIADLEARRDSLTRQEAHLSEQLSQHLKQLEKVQADRAKMLQDQEKAERVRRQVEAYGRAAHLITRLRSVFQRSAPELAGRYLQRISREATRCYRALEPRDPAEVLWREDYQLSIRGRSGQDGALQTRHFSHLSGGEKVTLSLALRLALARVLSPVKMLFLDEPMAHLDQIHRQRLVTTLGRAARDQGITQILITDHDTKGYQIPHHHIPLEKIRGASQVAERDIL